MSEWIKYFGGGAALLVSSGLIQYFITRYDSKHDKYKEIQSSLEELRGLLAETANDSSQQKAVIRANSALLLGLAQDRLVFLTDKYLKRGVITLDELAILEEIYEPYHDKLGGNGRGKAGIELCRQLPIVSEEIALMKDKEV